MKTLPVGSAIERRALHSPEASGVLYARNREGALWYLAWDRWNHAFQNTPCNRGKYSDIDGERVALWAIHAPRPVLP